MTTTNELTEAQRRALHWLTERGGSGVIDSYGRVVAAGEDSRKIATETWLRLFAAEKIVGRAGRIEVVVHADLS